MTVAADPAMLPTTVPIFRAEGEGERIWFAGGGIFTRKVTAAETNGAFVLFENRLEHGHVTPLHIHPHEDETFFMLEGEILVHHEGTEYRVGAGGVAFVPRGVAHAFMVTSKTSRILVLQTPGTGEAFYLDASEPVTGDSDLDRPADMDLIMAAARRHPDSIQFTGPPPFQMARG
jgi:quercetin dioxygenase-like cupin family protein